MTTTHTVPSEESLPFLDHWADSPMILPPWAVAFRCSGRARYKTLGGVPTSRVESWKYTDLTHLRRKKYLPSFIDKSIKLFTIPENGLLTLPGPRLVLVNGSLAPHLSSSTLPDGLVVQSLAQALRNDDSGLGGQLLSPENAPAMAALNAAWLGDGLVVRLKDGLSVDQNIHLIFVYTIRQNESPIITHPYLFLKIESGCCASLIESHIGLAPTLTNMVTSCHVEHDATLTHIIAQSGVTDAHAIGFTTTTVASRGLYRRFVLTTGLGLVRNELVVTLAGSEAGCRLHGAYTAESNRHVDNTIFVDHAAPATTSRQMFKGVLDDGGRGVFQGCIGIRPHAQKSDGNQIHKALLLSPRAEVDCKPELEIYADNVQCSHGATAGALDEDTLFYLRTRGLNVDTARTLLIKAFLDDVVDAADVPMLSDAARAMVSVWLAGRLTQAHG